jgi:hypothetical protein
MKKVIDIKNKELPVAKIIRDSLLSMPEAEQYELLEKMTVGEFVSHRVDIFLKELEVALLNGDVSPAGAEEIAFAACMSGLIKA